MASIQLDVSGRRGLSPRFFGDIDRDAGYSDPNFRHIAAEGQMVSGYYNPFRRYGYLSGSNTNFATVDQPTPFADLVNCVVYDEVNNDIIFGSDGRYYQGLLDGLDDVQFYLGGTIGDLGAAGTPRVQDLEIYQINGVRQCFFVYETGGQLEVGHFPLPYDSGAAVSTFFTTRGGAGISFRDSAFMISADNGFAYIFADNQVHRIDGTALTGGANGTVYPGVLVFPDSYTITDALDVRGSIFISIMKAKVSAYTASSSENAFNIECGVYIWNRQSYTTSTSDFVPIYGIKTINKLYITGDGSIRALVTNSNGITEIREYNGQTFIPIAETGRSSFPRVRDSVTSMDSCIVWLGNNGDIYAHGKIAPNEPEGLYKIGKLPESNNATGAIFFGGANAYSGTTGYKRNRSGLYVSYKNSANTPLVKQWDIFGTGASSATPSSNEYLPGNIFTPVKYLPEMSFLEKIVVYLARGTQTGSTTTGSIKLYINQETTALMTKTVTRDDKKRGYAVLDVNKPYVNAVQMEFIMPSGIVVSPENDMAPSLAFVHYKPERDEP